MLTQSKLEQDPQGVIYGMYLATIRKMGLTDKLNLKWVYYLTRGAPEARILDVTTTRVQLERVYFPMSENAEKLVQLRSIADRAMDIEPNYNACGAFGGCPHISKCETKSVYSGINTNKPKEGSNSMSALMKQLQERARKRSAKTNKETQAEAKPAVVISINPPESEPAEPESQPETPMPVEESMSQPETPMPDIEPEKVETKAPGIAIPTAAKTRKAGRPKGSKNKPKPTARVKEVVEQVATADVSNCEVVQSPADLIRESRPTPPESQVETEGYTLYINCIPSSGAVDVTKRLREIATQCAEDNGVDDYRYIRFGEAPARFSKSVTASLQDNPLRGKITVESSNLMIKDCIEVLIENATEVVRAIR